MSTTEPRQMSVQDYALLVHDLMWRGGTDGFPVIAPYPEGTAAMIAVSGRAADDVLGSFAFRPAPVTVGQVAEQALMAGCLPAYMPLLLTVFEILLEPSFGTERWAAATGAYFPWVFVNGPLRHELGINCKHGVLGPGVRANSTIGRAICLGLTNLGGFILGSTDHSTLGSPSRWAAVVGEDEEGSPWAPLHVDRGFQPADSTVTVVVGRQPRHFTHQLSLQPEHLVRSYAEELDTVGSFSSPTDPDDPFYDLSDVAARARRRAVVIIAEDHRSYFDNAGWTKRRVQEALLQHAGRRLGEIKQAGIGGHGQFEPGLADDLRVPYAQSADQFLVVSAGSGGGRATIGTLMGEPVTRKVPYVPPTAPPLSGGSSPIATHAALVNRYFERAATDGHPIIPPSSTGLAAMIEGSGRRGEEPIGKIGYSDTLAMVKDIALNALMAGCKPEHMPLVLSAYEIVVADGGTAMASTGSHWPSVIVNGPIRKQLGITSSFGPGSPTNAVIGRALTLAFMNLAKFRPGVIDKSSLGRADKYNLGLIGEHEEDSPWAPLHTEYGFSPQDSTVMVLGDHSYVSINHEASSPEELLIGLVEDLCTIQIFDAPTVNQGGKAPPPLLDSRTGAAPPGWGGGGGGAVIYLGGGHRQLLRRAGWTRRQVQEFVAEHLGRTIGQIRAKGYVGGRIAPERSDAEFIGTIQDPATVIVLAAGSEGNYSLVNRGGVRRLGIRKVHTEV